jgi:N-methylhydantoinase A
LDKVMTVSEQTISTLKAPWRIGIDVGGTFTDLMLADSAGVTRVAKVPSVPSDPSRGVLAALEHLAGDLGCTATRVLQDCALFVHGSTVATNTMLEGKGAKVGLLTTSGFRDALELRRGLREDQWNHRAPYAPVLVPRHLPLGCSTASSMMRTRSPSKLQSGPAGTVSGSPGQRRSRQ